MTILIIVVVVTLFISASCSLYEAVLYSTRPASLEASKKNPKKSKIASQFILLKKNISQPIAAILILNTVANTAGATIAGMYATTVLGASLVPLFSIILTLFILFLSEIIPKTIGAVHWKTLWPYIVYPLQIMKTALYPAIFITEKVTRLITKKEKTSTITEEEILALVHLGAREGEISRDEGRIVRNIINLENRNVAEIMTPRKMIFSLESNISIDDAFNVTSGSGFTRIPVYENHSENIIGYVVSHEISKAKMLDDHEKSLKSILRPIPFVSENTNCLLMLTNFLKHHTHIAVVKDEFGGIDGIVSMEDLLETLLGSEIIDETDQIIDLREAARKTKTSSKKDEGEKS